MIAILMSCSLRTSAREHELKLIRCTCYCQGEFTNGNKEYPSMTPTESICAGRYEDIGKVAILYQRNADGSVGEYIGMFEFRDTGSHESLKNGTSIDVYRSNLERCYEWIAQYGDYVYIQYVDAKG